jgi:glycosyltransferase involved in cell wall biosynthesis
VRQVHIITRFIRGGADENTQITCNLQAEAGDEVTLIVGGEWEASMKASLHPAVEFIVVPTLQRSVSPQRDLASTWSIYRHLKKIKPDLVHTHTSKAGIVGRLAAVMAGTPYIVHGVHILPFANVSRTEEIVYTGLERLCGAFTHAFVYVSANLRDDCVERRLGRSAQHIVAPSGMDVGRFATALPSDDAAMLRASPVGAAETPFVLLMAAALEERKGQLRFLKVLREIVDERPNVVLLMAGDGVERPAIEAEIDRLGLHAHARVLGFRKDLERLLALSDVALVCSRREGLPRVAVQAAIAGVPIVTTALPGIDTVVTDNEGGYVVPVDDLSAMKAPILKLIDEPRTRARFHAHLKSQDYTPWTAERMVETIGEVYRDLQARSGKVPALQSSAG